MKIAVIFGTRPEIIKLSPIIRALKSARSNFFVIHTNQHYDKNMDAIFLKELNLPKAKYNLHIGSGTHANMTGRILIEVEKIFIKEKPDLLIVQGDTNTVLAVALAASKLQISIAHIEAGLRSYSKIPEETNRILTDHISEFLFAPTETQKKILINEGISHKKIHVVGNTVVDAVTENLQIAKKLVGTKLLKELKIKQKKYFLVTAHREENVDKKNVLETIIKAISHLQKEYGVDAVFPMHPRTAKRIEEFKIKLPPKIKTIDPIGYLEMLTLMQDALFILTDSGGIQEEACTLNVPCITMRDSTERPESVEVGANILAGTHINHILEAAKKMLGSGAKGKKDQKGKTGLKSKKPWKNPFGKGDTAEKIVKILI